MKTIGLLTGLSTRFCANGNDTFGHMYNHHYMFGPGGGPLFWLIIVVVFIAIIAVIYLVAVKGRQQKDNALDILKNRYARGEITKKEFDQIKKDL